jgi:hypothetical protein
MENKSKELLSLVRALNIAFLDSPGIETFGLHGDLVHLQDKDGSPVAIIKVTTGKVKIINTKRGSARNIDIDIIPETVAVIVSAMLGQKGIVAGNKPVQPAPQAEIVHPSPVVVEQPVPVVEKPKGSFFDLNRKS